MKIVENNEGFTIYNFDRQINAKILQRGEGYYENGAVLNLDEDRGTWTAEVEGTENYEVTVSLTGHQDINSYFCDCPYDGKICKHVVAVLFQLRDEIKILLSAPQKISNKQKFEVLLNKITADEYRNFIAHHAKKDKNFKAAFELFFADKDDNDDAGQKYVQTVKNAFRKFSMQAYDYRGQRTFMREVDKLIGDTHHLIEKNKLSAAFNMGAAILEEMMEVWLYADDSDGAISERISDSIQLISEFTELSGLTDKLKEEIFSFLAKQLKNERYFDADLGDDLYYIFEKVALNLNREKAAFDFLDRMIEAASKDIYSYRRNMFIAWKDELLKKIHERKI
ncbi:SWIM zinc finger family protein [Mucilaginibacter celer]|uniref:SWIM zinc finger family protein n=1 Tax=Mucilaginibacter celer TaxID=2305508 RepID=UPI0013CEE5B9|nr:SWIM zinc finger family protein [Mucilaginibacter celer]